jgi:hypothetical protein
VSIEVNEAAKPEFHRQTWVIACFAVYALVLLTMTHWPRLEVPGPEGTDKWLHILAFGGWCGLFTVCGWFGRPMSDVNLLKSCMVAGVYAGVDEAMQGMEWVHRSCEWADAGANFAGVLGTTLMLLLIRAHLSRLFPRLLPT